MVEVLSALLDKQDSFELVRNQLLAIVFENAANQETLAIAASRDPAEWKLRVFRERVNPWEQFGDQNELGDDRSPIVNLWFQTATADESQGNVVSRQTMVGTFNFDVYARGLSQADGSGGQIPGDLDATLVAERAARHIRNYVMSSRNVALQFSAKELPEFGPQVGERWLQQFGPFQPDYGEYAHEVVAWRVGFRVAYNEHSPQYDASGSLLEYVGVTIKQASNGMVIGVADFDYTT